MIHRLLRSIALLMLLLAAATGARALPLPAVPPNINANENLPMVMMSISKDVTMFSRAYTDFDDIDFDGTVDYTFKPGFQYYGYFDPTKCYLYSSANGRFEPSTLAANASGSGNSYCAEGAGLWSGNFLNWATMSRIDVLRKVLYGGLRSSDTATGTTLELSFVPRNSQSIAKYYNGTDLAKLTPYNAADTVARGITLCRRPAQNTGVSSNAAHVLTPEIRVAVGNLMLWNMTEVQTCNWDFEPCPGSRPDGLCIYTWQSGTRDFLDRTYVTPSGDRGTANAYHKHLDGVPSSGATYGGLGPGFVARVQVCVTGLLEQGGCKKYDNAGATVWKPSGLLHEFGESKDSGNEPARAEFGLMLGSYDYNLSAGVLRKNMGQINDEINPATGQFVTPPSGGGGIVASLNEITLYNYNLSTGNYGETCYSNGITDGKCPSWGNPVGELLLESVLYYAGKSTGSKSSGSKDNEVGLPKVTAWADPITSDPTITGVRASKKRSQLYGQGMCRRLNTLTITSGVNSYDNDMPRFSSLGASDTVNNLTDVLGSREGLVGTTRVVGSATGASGNGVCTGKAIDALSSVAGVCPDAPNFNGTYLGAGVAYYANTRRVRSDISTTGVEHLPHTALTVKSYGITMSGGTAAIAVPVPGRSGKYVYITPSSFDSLGGVDKELPGNMVDFKILERAADGSSGTVLVLWQHNRLAEDQDQDMLGSIRYSVNAAVSPPQLTIYTQTVEASTGSTVAFRFGYTLLGSSAAEDRVHYHSGLNNAKITETGVDTSLVSYRNASVCDSASTSDKVRDIERKLCAEIDGFYVRGETSRTYTMSGSADAFIREPLWYMTKYGGFNYAEADKPSPTGGAIYPTTTAQWDQRNAAGRPCAGTLADPCDGNPDTYFYARQPKLLEDSLRAALEDIVSSSNTSPAIAASQLRAGDLKYVAKFDATDGRGELLAYPIQADGTFSSSAVWGAHESLKNASATRQIITNNGPAGVRFQWSDIGTAKQGLLKGTGTDTFGQQMLAWLRGDTTPNSLLRLRSSTSVMGSVVNSNPTVQVPPNGNFFGTAFAGYSTLAKAQKSRKSVIWVGAGDGMLHGFEASSAGGGKVLLSYVPEPVFDRLKDWAAVDGVKVQSFVDGSPFTGDVKTASGWATYLFGPLGRGGKGLFALDVTDPANFTEDRASTVFKWQFTQADDAADLGYIVSEPSVSRVSNQAGQIAMMNNGKSAVLVGNGVLSTKEGAVLYILFADGPDSGGSWSGRYVKLVADPGSTTAGNGNGLSQPTWIDVNGDGVADAIYAGDMKGNLWKFDVSSASSSSWAVAYGGRPLFTAKDSAGQALPITGGIEYRFHPNGGVMVNFATGKALVSGDFPSSVRNHSIFGIWDKASFAALGTSALGSALPGGLSALEPRSFVAAGDSRYVTGGTINWETKLGWYLPYIAASEMTVSNPATVNGQLAVVSVSPSPPKARSTDPDPCIKTPVARLTVVDPVTGLVKVELVGTTRVTNADGSISTVPLATVVIADQKVRISKDGVDVRCANGSVNCSRVVGESTDLKLNSANSTARIYWREVPGLKTRTTE